MLLTLSHLSKHYGAQTVLNELSASLNSGERVGLVGPNGVGKSTLFKLIVGEIEPDSGEIRLAPGSEIGYLAQTIPHGPDDTVDDVIAAACGNLRELERRLRLLERAMGAATGEALDAILAEYSDVASRFEQRDGYLLDIKVPEIFAGLGIVHISTERRFATLSGGEQARVGLAALLLQAPDLLLLDEPTNHLDLMALAWLENYLQAYRGAILVISHDRRFLNATVQAIWELDEHQRRLQRYEGNYDGYLQARAQARIRWMAAYTAQQEEIQALRQAIRGQARAVGHNRGPSDGDKLGYKAAGERVQQTVSRNVRAAEEKLRRIEADPIPKPPEALRIRAEFDPQVLGGKASLVATGLTKGFGARTLFKGVDLVLRPGDRVVLIGANGAGKSTLLRILAGLESPDEGRVALAPSVSLGYLDQGGWGLRPQQTLFEAYAEGLVGYEQELKNEFFRHGLFGYADLYKPVGTLSVGQQRKLQLARLVATRANLLLLDEPTNHLSFDVLEEFEEALMHFPGAILAISHDRWFIQRFATAIIELGDGGLRQRATLDLPAALPAQA